MIVKGFLDYSFAVSVDKKLIVKKQRRDRGPALTVTDYGGSHQLGLCNLNRNPCVGR